MAPALWPLRREEAAAVAGSAALFTVAFPPFPLVVPAFVCLAPLAVSIARAADGEGGVHGAVRIGFWFGVLAYAVGVYWIVVALLHFTRLAPLGFVAALVVAGMLLGATAASLAALRRVTHWPLAVLLPLVWVALEVAMANLPGAAFPWLPLGLAASTRPVLAQIADLSGVHAVSFAFAAVNGLLADAWLAGPRVRAVLARGVAAVAVIAGTIAYGVWRTETIAPRAMMDVAIVQPNVPQREKWLAENGDRIVASLASLTRTAAAAGAPALVVWPEAALPGWIESRPEWLDTVATLVEHTDAPLLFGALSREAREGGGYEAFNVAFITDASGRIAQSPHRKRDLVPLVERAPFGGLRLLAGVPYFGGYSPGAAVVFDHPHGRIGTLICYESVFARRSRALRRDGADVLVNITNDAWFGRSLGAWQHEAHLVLRAIETRAGIVRAANTGFSGFVDPLGRVAARTPLFEPAVRVHTVTTTDIITPYVRFGDWVGALSALIVLAGLVVYGVRERAT